MDWTHGLEDWISSRAEEILKKARDEWLKANDAKLAELQAAVSTHASSYDEWLKASDEKMGAFKVAADSHAALLTKQLKDTDHKVEVLRAAAEAQHALQARQEQLEDQLRRLQLRLESIEHAPPGSAGSTPRLPLKAVKATSGSHDGSEAAQSSPLPPGVTRRPSDVSEQDRPVVQHASSEGPAPRLLPPTQTVRSVSLSPVASRKDDGRVSFTSADDSAASLHAPRLPTLDDGEDDSEVDLPPVEALSPKAAATQKVSLVKALAFTAVVAAVVAYPQRIFSIIGCTTIWLLYWCSNESILRQVSASASSCAPGTAKRRFLLVSLSWVLRQLTKMTKKRRGARFVKFSFGIMTLSMTFSITKIYSTTLLYLQLWQCGLLAFVMCIYLWNGTPLWIYALGGGNAVHTRRRSSADLQGFEGSEAVRKSVALLRDYLGGSARWWHRFTAAELSAVDMLSKLERNDLNDLIEHMPEDVLRGTLDSFPQTVKLLCEELSEGLGPAAKARLIDALMSQPLTNPTRHAAVEHLLITTQGDELTIIKCIQDDRGNTHSMRNLVYENITDKESRERILAHFLTEAVAQLAHRTLLESPHFVRLLTKAKKVDRVHPSLRFMASDEAERYDGRCLVARRKILFDVDDTMHCSAGQHLAGIDKRYPHHALYPGFLAFLKELHGGDKLSQMAALSARPGPLEASLADKFQAMKKRGMHATPALLLGEMGSGFQFMTVGGDHGMKALAETKIKRVREYLRLYPEFRFIFMGDNGQGDYMVGNWMFERFPDCMEQVYIHQVQDEKKTPFYAAYQSRKLSAPITFVSDWVTAAVHAVERQPYRLIEPAGLLRIVEAAEKDFHDITGWLTDEQKNTEKERLWGSIRRAKDVLRKRGFNLPPDESEDEEDVALRRRRPKHHPGVPARTLTAPALDGEHIDRGGSRKWTLTGWWNKDGSATAPAAAGEPPEEGRGRPGKVTLQVTEAPDVALPNGPGGKGGSKPCTPELRPSPAPGKLPPPSPTVSSAVLRLIPNMRRWGGETPEPEGEVPQSSAAAAAAAAAAAVPPLPELAAGSPAAGRLVASSGSPPEPKTMPEYPGAGSSSYLSLPEAQDIDRSERLLERFESFPDFGPQIEEQRAEDAAGAELEDPGEQPSLAHGHKLHTTDSFASANLGSLHTSESGGSLSALDKVTPPSVAAKADAARAARRGAAIAEPAATPGAESDSAKEPLASPSEPGETFLSVTQTVSHPACSETETEAEAEAEAEAPEESEQPDAKTAAS